MKTDASNSGGFSRGGQAASCATAVPERVLPFACSRHERILVLNTGSSSFKWSYFDTRDETQNASGRIEHEGWRGSGHDPMAAARATGRAGRQMAAFVAAIREPAGGLGRKLDEVTLIAHRVVHGGTAFVAPAMLRGDVLVELERLVGLAPLHMPLCLEGIQLR